MSATKFTPEVIITKFAPLTLKKSFGADENGEENFATLVWSIRKGYPRITIYTDNSKANKEKTKTNGVDWTKIITAPMDIINLETFMDDFEDVINHDGEIERKVECWNIKYVDNKPTDEVVLQATIHVKKNDKGFIYLSAIEEGKKKVNFVLLPKDLRFVKFNGEDVKDYKALAIKSKRFAKAYLKVLRNLMSLYGIVDNVKDGVRPTNTTNSVNNNSKPKPSIDDLFE